MNIILARRIVFVLGLIPLFRLFVLGYLDDLTANPIEFITRSTGTWTITFLCMTLAMSPLRWITGFSQWVQLRKTLGLFTFFYGFLHFTIWYWLDHNFSFAEMISDVIKRPFITMGFIALLIMSLLAVTSNQTAMRLLGGKWKTLHRFIYLIAIFSLFHYIMHKDGKRDFTVAYIYAGIIIFLLFIRIPMMKRFITKW
jgi:sulfoxide reductase heme-binding subunit YedZ